MVAPLIGAGIRAAGAVARGLAKKFGKKLKNLGKDLKAATIKPKKQKIKEKLPLRNEKKLKKGLKQQLKQRQKPQVLQEPLAQPISLVGVCRHRKLAL
jgi:hypothetical protein